MQNVDIESVDDNASVDNDNENESVDNDHIEMTPEDIQQLRQLQHDRPKIDAHENIDGTICANMVVE
jgi:hypothetical protein